MKKYLITTLVSCCSVAVWAATRTWSGAGENALLTNPANWQDGGVPSASGDALTLPSATATRVENDLAGLVVNGISLNAGEYVLTGLPWIVQGGVTIGSGAGETQTFDADLRVLGRGRVLDVPAGHTAIFNGVIGYAETANCSVNLNGEGTKILRGGMKASVCTDTDNDANGYASRLQNGTFLIEGDVDLPRFILGNSSGTPAHLVVTNGAALRNWMNGKNTFVQSCIIDLIGGRMVSEGSLLFAQDYRVTTQLRVLRDGFFSTGASFRCANNGIVQITVEDGGTFYWMSGNFSENGQTVFTLNGGRLVRGINGREVMPLGQQPANDTSYQNKGGNIVNLNGGEIWAGAFANNSNLTRNKGTVTTFNCNGGTFMCGISTTAFWQGDLPTLAVVAQAGGIRLDTRGCNIGWPKTATGEGGFTKLGVGTLTFSARQDFTGPIAVRAGVVAASDPTFVTQRVELSPGATFAPGGTASLAGLAGTDGILRLVCTEGTTPLTLAATPEVEGTLFFELQNVSAESLVAPGTYPLIAAPGLTDDFAAHCQVRNGAAGRVYTFAVVEGVLTVTVAEGTNPVAGAVKASWTAAAGGDWQTAANWSAGVPNGVDAEATLGPSGAGPVTLGADATVASLTLDGASPYTVTGEGTLTFGASNGYTCINAQGGTHEVAVPVVAGSPLRISTSNGGKLVLSGDVSGAKDIQVIGGTVASPTLETLPNFLLAEGVFEYTGTGAGTAEGELRQNGNGTIRQMEGAGPMTLKLAPYLTVEGTLRLQGTGAAEIALDGTGWMWQPPNGRRLALDGGAFHFLPGLRMVWDNSGDGMTRIGSQTYDRPTTLTIDDGVRVQWRDAWIGSEREGQGDSAVRVEQKAAEVVVNGGLCLNRLPQTNDLDYVLEGGTLSGAGWINFMHAASSFRQTDGTASFKGLSFGLENKADGNFVKQETGGRGLLDLQGGTFTVSDDWNWQGELGGRRVDRVRVAGGTLTMPATQRATAYDPQRPAGFSTLELAEGTLRFGGAVSGSADDYLAGLNYLSLTGAATLEAAADASVTQPLVVAADATALTKTGAGSLTLAATNDLPAKVSVDAGTLAAQFRTDAKANVPDGLLAFWTFDGEDPYRDATGHGYDLVQAVEGVDVQFSEDLAHAGKSAWWQTAGAALKCTNIVSALLQRTTISLWVRLETKNYYKSHIGMFSFRNNLAATGQVTFFDLAYKASINGTMPEPGIGNCFFGSNNTGIPKSKGGDISAQAWHMVTVTRDEGRVRGYIDGVLCTDVDIGENNRGGTLLAEGRMITLGANISSGGTFGEMMNANGRLDDVAIYSRCLSDDEVAALFAAQEHPSVAEEVQVVQGATLNLRSSSLTTALLGGAGTVADGTVTVNGTLAVDPASPLTVDQIVLGGNGVVNCGRTTDDPLPTKGTVVVAHANAVTGDPSTWTVTGTGWEKGRGRASLAVNADQDLVLELTGSGTTVIFR